MVRYLTIPPSEHLKPYIRFFWILEMDLLADTPYVYRSLADGCAELVLHYKGSFRELIAGAAVPQSRLLLHAQQQQYRRFITGESFGILGAYIYPFALPRLFGMPASAFSNEMPSLQEVLGNAAGDLEERLMLATGNTQRIAILEDFLSRRLTQQHPTDTPVNDLLLHLIHTDKYRDVKSIAQDCGLSARQLERRFKASAGFSPKLYMRIMRFHRALKQYGNTNISLTRLAYDCGYYDQSHFIHDFKQFSGFHPSHYFAGNAEGAEYRSA